MMRKRGVEISLNTIIVAAIALLVLIVLIIIFTGQSGKFNRGMLDCKSRGGGTSTSDCAASSQDCLDSGGIPSGDCIFYIEGASDPQKDTSRVCCAKKRT
jgi:hypothetical protein